MTAKEMMLALLRRYGPMTSRQLWLLVWGNDSPARLRADSKRIFGFYPADACSSLLMLERKGLTRRVVGPRRKIIWEARDG